jgi:hypothetical protein
MILGITFSIFNFISINVKGVIGGGGAQGKWINGECQYVGTDCPIGIELQ